MSFALDLRSLWGELSRFPWRGTLVTLRERFREDRLGLTASSLTFTTTIALVPLITVVLAVFTAFPMFGRLQTVVQRWLIESVVPENIARQVLSYLTQFASQASRLGSVGVVILMITALMLMLTIDRTLNGIWRVQKQRKLAQRMLIYWSALTLGPLLIGASVAITSYAVSASRGFVARTPGGVGFALDAVQYLLLAGGTAALYRFVPNTPVKWAHAWTGGLFASTAIELAKNLLTLYLTTVPTYSVVYGTFATVPILLVWIYLAWTIVLLGAVITAYLPSLLSGVVRRDLGAGWHFQLALEVLQLLHAARGLPEKGRTTTELATALRVSTLGIEAALAPLVELDWVARLDEALAHEQARYVLLADPKTTLMAPLMHALLLRQTDNTERMWRSAGWEKARMAELL